MRVGLARPSKKKRGASAGCAGTGPRRRVRLAGLEPAGGRGPSAVCEAADGRARAQGQVPSATLTRTPRARRRLDPWPRASAPRVGSLKRVSARTHPSGGWDGRGLRQGRGHPLEGAGSGEAGDPECSRAVSSRAQRRIRPKLLALRRLTSTHRPSSFRPFEPDLPRAMPPHDQTPPEVPLCRAGRASISTKQGTLSSQRRKVCWRSPLRDNLPWRGRVGSPWQSGVG